jgi:hypothetical protein
VFIVTQLCFNKNCAFVKGHASLSTAKTKISKQSRRRLVEEPVEPPMWHSAHFAWKATTSPLSPLGERLKFSFIPKAYPNLQLCSRHFTRSRKQDEDIVSVVKEFTCFHCDPTETGSALG